MMNKMMKNVAMVIAAGTMILGTACTANAANSGIDFDFSFTNSETTSETTTVENSQGSSYEVTHTITNVDGDTDEYYENVPCEIYNETDEAIAELYIVPSEADNWGTNVLEAVSEGFIFEGDGHMWGLSMDYHPNTTTFDVKMVFTDGRTAEFSNCALDELDDAYHINVEIVSNGDGNYTLYLV